MGDRRTQVILSVGAIACSALLLLAAIPYGVSTPSNVGNIFLSPRFWPNVLAWLTGIIGALLAVNLLARRGAAGYPDDGRAEDKGDAAQDAPPRGAGLRLALMAAVMAIYLEAIGGLGMVWASIAAFIALAFLVRTAHPVAAIVTGLVAPLALYVFFAHVAGVSIPQGAVVRLP